MQNLNWEKVAPHPSNILIAGDVGTGKTALAATYIDYTRAQKINCYSVGRDFPHCKRVTESFTPGINSVILVDDVHLSGLYAHRSEAKTTRIYDYMQRQKRHRNHSIIYTTQDTTGFTLRLIRLLDAICLFHPNMMGLEYERPKIKTRYTKAKAALSSYSGKYGYVWIQSQNRETHEVTEDVYKFSLPSWWNDQVSVPEPKRNLTIKPLNPILEVIRGIGRVIK